MKALELKSIGHVALMDVDKPVVGPDELLVRTGAAVICTSDITDIRSNPFGIPLPVILGHEAAGTVAVVGGAVRGFCEGDRVTTHPVHPCGQCAACAEGLCHLCERMGHFGVNRPGTFAEFYTVRWDRARRIPMAVDFARAALSEPVAVCLEAIQQARLKAGDRLLIVGDGPFGILIAQLVNNLKLAKTVITGHHDFRLALARDATQVNTRRLTDPQAELLRIGAGGYDAAILAVGRADACRLALGLLRPRGRLVVFSALPGDTPLDLFRVHVKELEIVGACNDQDRFDDAVRIMSDPKCRLGELITHRFPLADYEKALALAGGSHQEAIKVAFVFPKQQP